MNNWFMHDDVEANSWFGFDYCFCGSDCKNATCGRNHGSESYKAMCKSEPVHSEADFSKECKYYMTEEETIQETIERSIRNE